MGWACFPQGRPVILNEESPADRVQGPRSGSVSGTLRGEMCTVPERGYIRDKERGTGSQAWVRLHHCCLLAMTLGRWPSLHLCFFLYAKEIGIPTS